MRKILMLGLVLGLITSLGSQSRADQLWDNGPLSTGAIHAGDGTMAPAGTTWSELQPNNTVQGYGHQLTAGNRVADDFTLSIGSAINMITFYAYQSNTPGTTSTMTDLSLRIWDGGGPGTGTLLFGDMTTNYLTGTAFSNIYRTVTSAASTARPIMTISVDLSAFNLNLGAGTYWLDWSAAGTLASGPWAPPVTIVGLDGKPGANGLQSVDGGLTYNGITSGAVGFEVPQDLPFIINGTAIPEPSSFAICAIALMGMVGRRRRA